jgi:uncharacterized protein (DUF58 family)
MQKYLRTGRSFVAGSAAALGLGLLWGCGAGSSATGGPVRSPVRQFGNLRFTLSVPQATYASGAPIPMTLTVQNVGSQPVAMVMPTAMLVDARSLTGGQSVWQQSRNQAVASVVTPLTLAPGETRTFGPAGLTWDQRTNGTPGSPVAPGQYALRAWLTPGTVNGIAVSPEQAEQNYASFPVQVTIR